MQRLKSTAMQTSSSLVPLLHITAVTCVKKNLKLEQYFYRCSFQGSSQFHSDTASQTHDSGSKFISLSGVGHNGAFCISHEIRGIFQSIFLSSCNRKLRHELLQHGEHLTRCVSVLHALQTSCTENRRVLYSMFLRVFEIFCCLVFIIGSVSVKNFK